MLRVSGVPRESIFHYDDHRVAIGSRTRNGRQGGAPRRVNKLFTLCRREVSKTFRLFLKNRKRSEPSTDGHTRLGMQQDFTRLEPKSEFKNGMDVFHPLPKQHGFHGDNLKTLLWLADIFFAIGAGKHLFGTIIGEKFLEVENTPRTFSGLFSPSNRPASVPRPHGKCCDRPNHDDHESFHDLWPQR